MVNATSDRITAEDVPRRIAREANSTAQSDTRTGSAVDDLGVDRITAGKLDFERLVKEYSSDLISYALHKHRGNKTRTAQALGISRGKLQYQIKQLGLESSLG
jgi:DNA-binding NtrC family response regulator